MAARRCTRPKVAADLPAVRALLAAGACPDAVGHDLRPPYRFPVCFVFCLHIITNLFADGLRLDSSEADGKTNFPL